MLVFLSDTHLTDGSTCETISADAFNKLVQMLEDMTINAHASEIEVVFLGDIFDIIRSEIWLSTDIRPWSPTNKTDKSRRGIRQYTEKIVDSICQNDTNIRSCSI
jgi:UDP-2,3-diacylglucosamine pyrophosphatase LpxH